LSEEHITLIASVADELSQNLPGYAPKPLNMKKPADKELQVGRWHYLLLALLLVCILFIYLFIIYLVYK